MQKLVTGLHRFQNGVFEENQTLFETLAEGQRPETLFITCSDSRIVPNLFTQTQPGDLFILRNAGNLVPAHGASNGGEAATIEYAVAALSVKEIIVCGHSRCGAMDAIVHPDRCDGLPAVKAWLGHAEATRRIVQENYAQLRDQEALLNVTIQENVLVQLENLRTHPSVRAALSRGALTLHGWVYRFETGEVFEYRPRDGQFVPIISPAVSAPQVMATGT
jgi:carbonic anhydrase